MNIKRGLKYSLLTLGVLTFVTVSSSANAYADKGDGSEYDHDGRITWAPNVTGGTGDPIVSNAGAHNGTVMGSGKRYVKKSGTTFIWQKVGENPNYPKKSGHQVDLMATLTNISKSVKNVGVKYGNGISINMDANGADVAKSMDITFTFYDEKTGKQVQWDDDYLALAYSDLEPAVLGMYPYPNGKATPHRSYDQKVTSLSKMENWNPYSDLDGSQTWLNRSAASNKGVFQMVNRTSLPTNIPVNGSWGYDTYKKKVVKQTSKNKGSLLHTFWDVAGSNLRPTLHYSGGIGVYRAASGPRSIKVRVSGHSWGNDEFVFSGAKMYKKKSNVSTIGKSITYKGKTSTKNTLKDIDDPMSYNIVMKLNQAKKGAYITDDIPHRFTVTSASSVAGFKLNSVVNMNSTHKFKATINSTKYKDAKNKKVTFHINGNVGDWVADHPNSTLKWPFYNTAIWHKKSTDTPGIKSNKVTTMYNENPNEGKGKVIFKFIDFDHHTHSLKANKVITKLAKGKTYKPAASIKWKTNGKTYKYVMGKTDGRSGGTPKVYMHTNFQDI